MAVYVNTNYSALQGQRYLSNVQNSLTTTYQRLSSGMRINSAKDDAARILVLLSQRPGPPDIVNSYCYTEQHSISGDMPWPSMLIPITQLFRASAT